MPSRLDTNCLEMRTPPPIEDGWAGRGGREARPGAAADPGVRRPTLEVIEKSKEMLAALGFEPRDHFRGAAEMVELGSGAHREVDDVRLTRRDCSCVAANADPRKLAAILARAGSAGGEGGQQINEHD